MKWKTFFCLCVFVISSFVFSFFLLFLIWPLHRGNEHRITSPSKKVLLLFDLEKKQNATKHTNDDMKFGFGTFAIVVSTLLTLYITWLCTEWTLFSLHPVLMTFSFSFLIVEGILTVYRRKQHNNLVERRALVSEHVYLQFGTLAFAVLGFISAFYHKMSRGKRHFKSWHSWMGLVMMLGLLLEILLGMYLYYPKLRSLLTSSSSGSSGSSQNRSSLSDDGGGGGSSSSTTTTSSSAISLIKWSKRWHQYLGMIVFYAGVISMILGLDSNYMRRLLPAVMARFGLGLCFVSLMMAMMAFSLSQESSGNKQKKQHNKIPLEKDLHHQSELGNTTMTTATVINSV